MEDKNLEMLLKINELQNKNIEILINRIDKLEKLYNRGIIPSIN